MDLMDLMEMNIEMEISMIYPQTSEIYNGNGKKYIVLFRDLVGCKWYS